MKTTFVYLLAITSIMASPTEKRDKRQFLAVPALTASLAGPLDAPLATPVVAAPLVAETYVTPALVAAPAPAVVAAPAPAVVAAPAPAVVAAPAPAVVAAPAPAVVAAPAPAVVAAPAPAVVAAPAIATTDVVSNNYFAPAYARLAIPLVSKTILSPLAVDAPLFW